MASKKSPKDRVRIQVVVRTSESESFAKLAKLRDATEADTFRFLLSLGEDISNELREGGELYIRHPNKRAVKVLLVGAKVHPTRP